MQDWRDDFRQLAKELREEGQPEAVARLLEHVADLEREGTAQLEAAPWHRDIKALAYDELILASVALTRVLDTAGDMDRQSQIPPLDRVLGTLADEIRLPKDAGAQGQHLQR